MIVVIDLAPSLLYRGIQARWAKKSLELSLARLTGRDRMKVSQTRPRAKPKELPMYLVIDVDRNFLLLATRDMQAAYSAADKSEAKGIATIVRFDASFRQ